MTTTTATPMPSHSFARPRRAPVPLLLESFPAPPSHIPTPTTPNAPNPPPTGPPSAPLPPVPGPSRISEHEQFLLLSSATNRSRRSSKYSVTSQRESVVSISSAGHGTPAGGSSSSRTSLASSGKSPAHATSPLPPLTTNRDSFASTRSSPRSPTSFARPSISVSGTSPSRHTPGADQLTRMSISPMPLSDIEDDDGDLPPPVMPSPTLPRASLSTSFRRSTNSRPHHNPGNESISSIDVRDILGADDVPDEGGEDILPPFLSLSRNSLSASTSSTSRRFPSSSSSSSPMHAHQLSLADPIDPSLAHSRAEKIPHFTPSSLPPLHTNPETATHMRNSSGSVGSFSYPSSSKLSPVHALAATFTVPSTAATTRTKPPPLGPMRVPNAPPPTAYTLSTNSVPPPPSSMSANYAFPAKSTGLAPSLSTMTQFSASSDTTTTPDPTITSLSSPSLLGMSPSPTTMDEASASSSSLSRATSPTIKDLRLELRAERTRSAGLKKVFGVRSRSRSRLQEEGKLEPVYAPPSEELPPVPVVVPREGGGGVLAGGEKGLGLGLGMPVEDEDGQPKPLGVIVVTKTTVVEVEEVARGDRGRGKGNEEMTLEELDVSDSKEPASASASRAAGAGGGENKSRVQPPFIKSGSSALPPPAPAPSLSLATTTASSNNAATTRLITTTTTTTLGKDAAKTKINPDDPRAPSPDIATILSSTPRPALSKSISAGGGRNGASSRSRVRERPRRQSEGSAWAGHGHGRLEGEEEGDYYDEDLERVLEGRGSDDEEQAEESAYDAASRGRHRQRQKREDKEEEEEGDSDSSLDLHTPLPHLMVRHGLLSPNSKLLPGAQSRANTPMDGRPGSMLSVVSNASIMTKSGVIKDERDTPNRRVRHRDGKLLRGGIGLTTGLGWSDRWVSIFFFIFSFHSLFFFLSLLDQVSSAFLTGFGGLRPRLSFMG
ncbi:hypothetical protein BDZ97DRAFT_998929 [Flammula alnicola]|nr:hypothetical protein BDZ97DRAFT_998929 [Flammula alnicola]